MSVIDYRKKEIDKVINSVFKQFNVNNEGEREKLRNSLLQQMKANGPLLTYKENGDASSRNFRNDIRSFMVDTVAQLLALQDIEYTLQDIESQSRDMISFGNTRVAAIEKQAASSSRSGRVINETFDEASFTGTHNGTVVKDGFLRLDNSGKQQNYQVENLKIKTLPALSLQNGINSVSSGDLHNIFGTGVGSDTYWTILSSRHEPIIEYVGEMGHYEKLRGVLNEIEFTTSKFISPVNISAKFSTASRIYRVFAKEGEEKDWVGLSDADNTLCEDKTEGLYSLIDSIAEHGKSYNHFKIIIHTPTYTTEKNGRKYYRLGIYNLKLLEDRNSLNGKFSSNKYVNNDHVFKVNVDSFEHKIGGCSKYNVNFHLGNKGIKFPVIPGEPSTSIKGLILNPSYEDDTYNYYIVPFPIWGNFSVANPITVNDLTFGLTINGTLVPGTDASLISAPKGLATTRLSVSYNTIKTTPFLYLQNILDANTTDSPNEVQLKTKLSENDLEYDSFNSQILRCNEQLWNHVNSNESASFYLLRYTYLLRQGSDDQQTFNIQ